MGFRGLSRTSQTSKMELFMKIVKGWNQLTIFEKSSVLNVWLCSEYAFEFSCKRSLGWRGTDIPNTHEKLTKNQSAIEWYRCGKCEAKMDKNVECLLALPQSRSCGILWIVGYEIWWYECSHSESLSCQWNSSFLLKLQTAVLQLYLIWTPAQCLRRI